MKADNDVVSGILARYLKMSGIRISAKVLADYLRGETLRNTLRGVSDVLDHFGVPHMVVTLGADDLRELESPVLLEMNFTEEPFGILTGVEDVEVSLLFPQSGAKKLPVNLFLHYWTGRVLGLEKGDGTREEGRLGYAVSRTIGFIENNLSALIASAFFLLCTAVSITKPYSIPEYLYLILKAAGLIVTILILYKTFGDRSFMESFCRAGSKVDCQSVLDSKGARLFGWLGIGELALVYFLGTIIWGLVADHPAGIYAVMSVAAFTAVIYSVVYQAFVGKKWCLLCLGIDAVLAGELALTLLYPVRIEAEAWPVFTLVLTFTLILFLWLEFRKFYLSSRKRELLELKRSYFVSDRGIFEYLLAGRPPVPVADNLPVLRGTSDPAKKEILIITNPSCPKCRKLYHSILEVYDRYNLSLLLHLYPGDQAGKSKALETIRIYNDRGFVDAVGYLKSDDHPEPGYDYSTEQAILRRQTDALKAMNIDSVPLLLVDGKIFPFDYYDLYEMKYLL